jgi:hypothetical protein
MEKMPRPYPFGLVGARSAYQNIVHHLFIDHAERDYIDELYKIDLPKANQPEPVVNMVAIRQISGDSINDILEESPGAYSEGSTETVSNCPPFPLGFGGEIFHISHDSITRDGKTAEERDALLARNANRQHRRDEEATRAADGNPNGPPRMRRNLNEEFDMVGNQPVQQTPSANLAVVFNELEKLPWTLEVKKTIAHVKAPQVQVNEIWHPAPSYLTVSALSCHSCSSRHDKGS